MAVLSQMILLRLAEARAACWRLVKTPVFSHHSLKETNSSSVLIDVMDDMYQQLNKPLEIKDVKMTSV